MLHLIAIVFLLVQLILIPCSAVLSAKAQDPDAGLRFWFTQNIAFICALIGLVLLAPLAALRCWTYKTNTEFPDRLLPQWRGGGLTFIWGNLEDGVIGSTLYQQKHPNPRWCAYLWSACRNPANNLRFVFRWVGGPFYRWENAARTYYFQCGWYPNGFPVLSAGKIDTVPQA